MTATAGLFSDVAVEPQARTGSVPNVFDSIRDLVHEARAWQTAESLVRSSAYHIDMSLPPEEWYTWRSGIKAPCYCDCRHLNAWPSTRIEITAFLSESVAQSFSTAELIVGMATAGVPWARGVADTLGLPLAYVRGSQKAHGVGGLLECSPKVGAKAVLIDDLAASGDSLKRAIGVLGAEAGIETIGVHTIVNWGFPSMRENLTGVRIKALTSFPYILTHALAQGRIADHELLELIAFYQNPKGHVWNRSSRP